jgi:hypothetical protein
MNGRFAPEAVIPGKSAFDPLVRRCAAAIRILKGIESDILVDGSLDYPDDVLDRFDFDPEEAQPFLSRRCTASPVRPAIELCHGFLLDAASMRRPANPAYPSPNRKRVIAFLIFNSALPVLLPRLGDVSAGEPSPYPHPSGFKLGLAILKIGALSAVPPDRLLAVNVAAPRPLIHMIRKTGIFSDPANRQPSPDHRIVVGVALPVDLGGVNGDAFVVEHRGLHFA